MRGDVLLEVCVDSAEAAEAARRGGADRVELCAGLVEGGTTPSAGALELCCERARLPVMVLVRPRAGDFLYDRSEFETMLRDLRRAREAGAAGVVIGVLERDGRIDRVRTAELLAHAQSMQVTFHRAFDLCRDPHEGLDDLLGLGVPRLLTSGQAPSASMGAALLADLIARARDDLIVMPGGGVRAPLVRSLVERTGATEVHFSARQPQASRMRFRNETCVMGAERLPGEYERKTTRAELVRDYVRALAP